MAEQSAIGFAHAGAHPFALAIVCLRKRDRDRAMLVARHDLLAIGRIGEEIEYKRLQISRPGGSGGRSLISE